MPKAEQNSPATTSFERSLDILLLFRDHPDGLNARDVAEALGVSRSSTFRYLQLLRQRDLIEPTAQPGTFRLGPMILSLAGARASRRTLAQIAEPAMRHLAETTGESAMLTRRSGDSVFVLLSVDSPRVIRASIEAAQDSALHVGSFGKLHMAYLEPGEIDRLLAQPRAHVVTGASIDTGQYRAELKQIRNRGYAVSDGEVEVGMSSVSVPILSSAGELVACLSVAGPVFRLPQSLIPSLVRTLTESARQIADDWEAERRFEAGPGAAREAI